jgi:hypothetical protein
MLCRIDFRSYSWMSWLHPNPQRQNKEPERKQIV